MQKHLILPILLAFGLVAICSPTANLACRRRPPRLLESSTGGASRGPSNVVARATDEQSNQLAGDISLCGISIRGRSASACQGNPGFVGVKVNNRKVLEWKNWGDFSPAGNECDHLVELQLVKTALESIKFCDAWNGMLHVAESVGHVEFSQADKTRLFAPLKSAANDPRGLHYLDKDVNGEKEHFVAAVIRKHGPIQHTLPINSHVLEYINHIAPIGNTIAANIDHQAVEVLKELLKEAVSKSTIHEHKDLYACSLADEMEKATGFEDKITAVSTYWGYVRRSS